jgi:hypothetical protein
MRRSNELGPEGGTALARALRRLPELRVLNLGCATPRAARERAAAARPLRTWPRA